MSTILITGSSGFIGKELAKSLSRQHHVLCLSRRDPQLQLPWTRGDFGSFEDLRQLDDHRIDAVVHLAAVTGGCLERDGILVNVEGSRCLMRYLIDRGCRKFVMASSIAAVGCQSTRFRPLQLPMPDEHPCLDRDGYGFSKYLMEEMTRYYHRQNPDIDVINLRLSGVVSDGVPFQIEGVRPLRPWSPGALVVIRRSHAVRAITLAVEAAHQPGVRTYNVASPRILASAPTAEILRHWWGSDVDLSHYEQPGHEYDGLFDVRRIEQDLGFTVEHAELASSAMTADRSIVSI